MPWNIKLIQARDFIRTKATGHLDLEASKRLIADLASVTAKSPDCDLLIDLRETTSSTSATVSETYEAAQELVKFHEAFRGRRIAVVDDPRYMEQTRFFALCANNRGLCVGGFTSFEESIAWLTREVSISPDASPS